MNFLLLAYPKIFRTISSYFFTASTYSCIEDHFTGIGPLTSFSQAAERCFDSGLSSPKTLFHQFSLLSCNLFDYVRPNQATLSQNSR